MNARNLASKRLIAVVLVACCLAAVAAVWLLRPGVLIGTSPAAPQNRIAWRTDVRAALAEARQAGKPVFVDFNAAWCTPCIAMQRDVWPNDEVKRTLEGSFIPVAVDVDKDSKTADAYNVEGIPTILVLDAEGHVLRRAGYLPLDGMLRFLYDAAR